MKIKFYYTNGKTYTEREVTINPDSLSEGSYIEYEKALSDGRLDGFYQVKIYKDELVAVELTNEDGRSVFTYKSAANTKVVVTGYGH